MHLSPKVVRSPLDIATKDEAWLYDLLNPVSNQGLCFAEFRDLRGIITNRF